jgi:hypothetical protein
MDWAQSVEARRVVTIVWVLGGGAVIIALSLWGLSALLYPARTQAQALRDIRRVSQGAVWERYEQSRLAPWLTRLLGVLALGAGLALLSNYVTPVY